jgi:Xaa-Pro aminopeptidase
MRLEFPRQEFEHRLAAARALLDESGLEGLLLTAEANINYFTGYRHFCPWTTFTRPAVLLIPKKAEPVLLVQGFLRADAARDCWFPDVRGYKTLLGLPVEQTAELFREHDMAAGQVGAELGYEQRLGLAYNDFVSLQSALPKVQLTDAAGLLWQLRIRKSALEIDATRRSGQIAAKAFADVWAHAHEGSTEQDVAEILARRIGEEGGEVGFRIITSGSGDYDRTAGQARQRVLNKGDMLWIDLGVIYNGYWTDHCRAGVVGGPSDEQRKNWDLVVQVTRKGIDAIAPGVKIAEIVRACEDEARSNGLEFSFAAGRMGHGMGLMSTEPPHVASYDQTVLDEGMMITVEPGWVEPHGTYVSEENLAVTSSGADFMTVTPRDLKTI